jgi:hypothetical protein
MSMRSQKGADLRAELDRVRVKYEMLLNVSIEISDNDYHTLIINFVPPDISSVLAQMSLNMKQVTTSLLKAKVIGSVAELKGKLPNLVVEPEDMMQAALEEWDWCEADKKSRQKATASTTPGTALAAVSSEKPGAKSGGGKRCCGKPGECWNCREKGHKKTDCPNLKDESEKKDSEKSGGNLNKGKGASSSSGSSNSSSNRNSSTSRKSNAGAAVDEDKDTSRAWTVMDLTSEDGGDSQGLIEFNDKFESNQGFLSHDFGGVFSDDDTPNMEYDTNKGPNAHNRETGYTKCEENFPSIRFWPGEHGQGKRTSCV